jgi:hypothetical protein
VKNYGETEAVKEITKDMGTNWIPTRILLKCSTNAPTGGKFSGCLHAYCTILPRC